MHGTPAHLRSNHADPPSRRRRLEGGALDAVQQWRYEPYMCQGTPVEVETVIQVNYGVGY